MEKEATPFGVAAATAVRASVRAAEGDRQGAITLLTNAEASFQFADMLMYESAIRRQRGLLLGGEEGKRLISTADEFMQSQGIVRPDRIADMLVPGVWG